MAIKLERGGGGKALMAGPLVEELFFAPSLIHFIMQRMFQLFSFSEGRLNFSWFFLFWNYFLAQGCKGGRQKKIDFLADISAKRGGVDPPPAKKSRLFLYKM